MTKTLILGAVAAALFAGNASSSDFSLDGSVALTSDYRYRGISQSDDEAAIQGSINLNHTSGLHAGIWASSVDFNDPEYSEATLEADYTVGYSFNVSSLGVDVGYIYNTLPHGKAFDKDKDYGEVYGVVDWKGIDLGVNWTNDGYMESGQSTYVFVGYSHEFGIVTLGAEVGQTFFDEEDVFDNGEDKYQNFKVFGSVSILEDLGIEVAYLGTDLKESDIGGLSWAENTVVGTVTLNL